MPDTKSDQEVQVVEVTREEGRAMLDRAAREALNLSGNEFLAKWDGGDYEDADDPVVTRVAMLIPFAGRTPREAVDAFMEPLKDIVSCAARAKITLSSTGGP